MNDRFNLEAMAAGVNYNQAIFDQIMKMTSDGDKILDFGAGSGTFANRFTKPITCVEPDPDSTQIINQYHTILPNLEKIPHESLDLIYSVNVLEHIEDDQQVLAKLRSLLKLSGKLYLFVPARQELYSAMDARVGHVRRYCRESLVKKVSNSGYKVEFCKYFDGLGYFASLGLRMAGSIFKWQGGLSVSNVRFYDEMVFPINKIVDPLMGYFAGKNLVLAAVKQ